MAARDKLGVAVVGATGLAGQQFLTALADHPWYEVRGVAASANSAGKTLEEALRNPDGSSRWAVDGEPPAACLSLTVQDARELDASQYAMVFTAIESDAARELEPEYAKYVPVFSTASAFRYEPDVPILLPAVNPDQADRLAEQSKNRGWKGFIAPGPNCTVVGLAHALAPLMRFHPQRIVMTSLQAVSGAGRSPGVIGLDIIDNVIPFIPKEEEKVTRETQKIFNRDDLDVSCLCTRVPVLEGHTEAVFVDFADPASLDAVRDAMVGFGKDREDLALPSAPREWIAVHDDPFRPQPRLDRDRENGMATSVGRLGAHGERGVKFVLVSHNTKMGAARGAILTAEFLSARGIIG